MTYWEDRQAAGAFLAAMIAERAEQDRRAEEIGAVVVEPGEYSSSDTFELYNLAVRDGGSHPAGLLIAMVCLLFDVVPEIRDRTARLRSEIALAAGNADEERADPP